MSKASSILLAACISVLCHFSNAFAEDADGEERDFEPVLPKRSLFEQGRWIYEQNCVVCHGVKGDGKGELSATLVPKPRPFSSGVFKYHTTQAGKLPTNDDLKRTIRGGLAGTAMGMFTQLLDTELEAVAEYLKSFSPRWRKRENYGPPMKIPPLPEWFSNEAEKKMHAESGRVLFTSICAACHGASGKGDGLAAPTLKDMWGEREVPADLREAWLRRGTDLREVWLALTTGRDGTPMVSFAQTLTEMQRWDLVAFIETLRTAKASHAEK